MTEALDAERIRAELGPEWLKIVETEVATGRNAFKHFWTEGELLEVKRALESRGLIADRFLGVGTGAAVFTVQGKEGVVLRLESSFLHDTLDCPVTLTAMYDEILHVPAAKDGLRDIRVRALPTGVQPPELGLEDVLKTASVMKACGGIGGWEDREAFHGPDPETGEQKDIDAFHGIDPAKNHWCDVQPNQMYYLQQNGGYLSYPSDEHPIAYIGDIGCTIPTSAPANPKEARLYRGLRGYGPNVQEFLAIKGIEEPLNGFVEQLWAIAAEKAKSKAEQKDIPPAGLFAGWDKILRKIFEQEEKNGSEAAASGRKEDELTIALPQQLPEGWENLLQEVKWRRRTIDGHIDERYAPESIPADLEEKISAHFKKAVVGTPASEREYTTVPLKLVDDIIPPAPSEDVMACKVQRDRLMRIREGIGAKLPLGSVAGRNGIS